ncbi:IS200/IS605 family transposase [Belliella marina]|uniref:IS200/IS605 family transposase n=1 Tax=Belliella marina TaxID=1644146 RepID=A0ABW4VR24_9BACT
MGTYTQIIYHIVFSTKNREHTLLHQEKKRLYAYIHHLLMNKKCHLYRINGVEDHIHILTHVHPTIPVSNLIKEIKLASSDFISKERIFPSFKGWQDGYGAFTETIKAKERLIKYIKNQEEHHKKVRFLEEYKTLLEEYEIKFDPKFLL